MRILYVLVLLAALILAAGCTSTVPTEHPTEIVPTPMLQPTLNPDGDAAHGAALFVTWKCVSCHSSDASGRLGPSLAATRLSEEAFTTAIRQTRSPKPAFSEAELSQSDVRDIYVWLQSLEPAAEAMTVLEDGELLGIQVYTDSGCDSCHGAFAQGGEGPVLAEYQDSVDAFLEAMESSTDDIPEHSLEDLGRDLMQRLHNWLQEGANLDSGC